MGMGLSVQVTKFTLLKMNVKVEEYLEMSLPPTKPNEREWKRPMKTYSDSKFGRMMEYLFILWSLSYYC